MVRDLSEVTAKIRAVREARRKFLRLWAMEQAVIAPGLDRIAAEIEAARNNQGPITRICLNDHSDCDDEQ